ncbi:MAG: hypothetical protein LBQ00_06885, partial [Syntrophobacterales bacterium]|nr:hypothetical protein [Syntrophobacterales bacterium]
GNNGSSGGDTSITIGGTLYTVWGGGHVTTGTSGGGRTMADASSMLSVLGGLGGDTCQIGGQSIFGLCMHGHEGYRGIRMADTAGTSSPQPVRTD